MRGLPQMIGMMVSVNAVEHLDAHAEEARGFPFVDTRLHQPRRRGVTQRMRADTAVEIGQAHRPRKRCLDRLHGRAIPFDEVRREQPKTMPRRMCANNRAGNGTGGWRFFVSTAPSASR